MSVVANLLGRGRLLAAASIAALSFLAFPAVGHAATGYPAGDSGTVNKATVGEHGEVRFSGKGFTPRELIDISVTKDAAAAPHALPATEGLAAHFALAAFSVAAAPTSPTTVTADKKGAFAVLLQLGTPGTYSLAATGRLSGHVDTASVKVVAKGIGTPGGTTGGKGGAGGGLSFTGSRLDFAMTAWLGVGAIGLGIAFLKLSATRRRQESFVQPAVSGL